MCIEPILLTQIGTWQLNCQMRRDDRACRSSILFHTATSSAGVDVDVLISLDQNLMW